MSKRIFRSFLLSIALTFTVAVAAPTDLSAQCPMCRMSAESNLNNGGSDGKGLNAGILYMLATPYLLIGGLGYLWWRNRRRKDEEDDPNALV